jgi:branched-subunit amino acid ABC-type transport system permease component
MHNILLFALLGLGSGALVASVALGVVLSYRGSGIINLSIGAMVMLAGNVFWALRSGKLGFALPTLPALVLTLLVMIVAGAVIELAAFRPLRTSSPLAKLVASLAVLLFVQAAVLLIFGNSPLSSPAVLPGNTIQLLGVTVSIAQFILAGLVIVLAAVLALVYRYTRFGLATRAASESEPSALLVGLSPGRLAMGNTILANLIAGFIGVLAASIVGVDSTTLPLLIIPGLAAALFARFTSFSIAAAAGLLIGITESILYYLSTQSWFPSQNGSALPGVQQVLELMLIIAALWWRGSSLPRRGELVRQSLPPVPRQGSLLRRVSGPTVACAVALVVLPYDFRQALITGLVAMMLCLSFVVITGYVGQLSVVQMALAGVAGFTVSHLSTGAGIGFPLAAIIGACVATAVGLAVAVSALRVRGVTLVVLTLAGAEAIQHFVFANASWGGGIAAATVPQPTFLGLSLGTSAGFRGLDHELPSPVFGFFSLAVVVVLYLLVANIRRSSLGRRMLAVRSNERAAAAAGVHVPALKIAAFGIGSAIAGIAGVMYAYDFGTVSADSYDVMTCLALIAGLYVLGITMVQGAVLAGLGATGAVIPLILQKWVFPQDKITTYVQFFAALGLIIQLNIFPQGVLATMWRKRQLRLSTGGRRRLPAPLQHALLLLPAQRTGRPGLQSAEPVTPNELTGADK